MTCVVDTSYVMRLVDPDDARTPRVRALHEPLQRAHELLVPELINYEILNVAHRRMKAKLPGDVANRQSIVRQLLAGLEFVPAASGDRELIGRLVEEHGITAYDAAFLALAKTQPDAVFVTLDVGLHEAAQAELGERALDLAGLEAHLARR